MKPKLLYVINHVDWFWSHRLPLAKAAQDAGYDVHVAVHGASDPRFAQHGFTSHELPEFPPAVSWRLCKLVRRLKPDLMHAITLKYSFLAGLATRHKPMRRIFTIAGLGYLFADEAGLLRLMVMPLLKYALGNATIIVQNPDDRDILMKRGVIKSATLIRGSGVDISNYTPTKNNEETPPIVLMPTRLLRDKGVMVFAEAANILKARGVNARFQIAGGMEGHNPATLTESDMKSISANGAVEWLGRVNDMPALYARATVIAYPSWYREGVPKVLLESVAMGKAIVTTDHPGCREAVTHNVNGLLVPVKDANATANAIEKLLNDPALRQTMGAAGRKKAEEEFDVRRVVEKTLVVYAEGNRA